MPPPSQEQLNALAMLRKELDRLDKSELKNTWAIQASDFQCLKFLIGHKMKVDEAFKLMVKCSAWRYEFKTSELISKMEALNAPPEVRFAKAYLPMGVIGQDSEGRPVMLQRISAIDFPRVIGDFGLDKVIEYAIYVQEKLLENNPIGECIVIIDLGIEDQPNPPMTTLMEARAWIAALLKFLQPFAAIADPFYPEMFAKIFFTRAPSMFAATWSVAKNFVAEATREKIEILGPKATKRLIEVLPAETIPVFLGGSNQLIGLGKGGKLPKGAATDIKFLQKLESELKNHPEVSLATKELMSSDEDPVQKRAALDLLRAAINAEMTKMKASSEDRGSWKFVPGQEFLESLDDDELEKTLKENHFDHMKSFHALYNLALQQEKIKLPVQQLPFQDVVQDPVKKNSWYSLFMGRRNSG